MAESRIARAFAESRRQGRAALIGYLVAGDPEPETSREVVEAAAGSGLDLLELGVPYSDPVADGPAIAAAGQRALRAGAGLATALELARSVSERVPVVLFTYLNPVLQFGPERFAEAAAGAGVSGAIIPDVTVEETGELRRTLRRSSLVMPLLVAPTTPAERAAAIARASRGFLYVVSRMGVTGEGSRPDLDWLRARVGELRRLTPQPLAVGFGISDPDQVALVSEFADGVIVGSALVSAGTGEAGASAARRVAQLVSRLARATARAS